MNDSGKDGKPESHKVGRDWLLEKVGREPTVQKGIVELVSNTSI